MTFTTEEKLAVVEQLIETLRPFRSQPGTVENEARDLLKVLARDLRAAAAGAGPTAMASLEHRVESAKRQKARIGYYEIGTLQGIGEEVIGRWPVLRRALSGMEAVEAGGCAPAILTSRKEKP